jgi:hypothetical protein
MASAASATVASAASATVASPASERWKEYPAADGYEVSTGGNMRNKATKNELSKYIMPAGYVQMSLSIEGARKKVLLNRAVLETFIGPQPSEKHKAHILNGNRSDCRLVNLEWATESKINKGIDNSVRKGLMHQYTATNNITGEKRVYESKDAAMEAAKCGRKRIDSAVKKGESIDGFVYERTEKVQPSPGAEVVAIEDFPDCRVSSDGLIWKPRTFWTRGTLKATGYYSIVFGTKEKRVNCLVAAAYLDPHADENAQVNHIDGDKTNNHAENLEYVTAAGNTQHAVDTGLLDCRVPVRQTHNGVLVNDWTSTREACKAMVSEGRSLNVKAAATAICHVLCEDYPQTRAYGFGLESI